MIKFSHKGNWSKTNSFLQKALHLIKLSELDKYGMEGVKILYENTPKDSGLTAQSWYYKIINSDNSVRIEWLNSNVNDGIPIAILIQYGHGLQNGGYVDGIDYINPSMKPLFDEIVEKIRKELS